MTSNASTITTVRNTNFPTVTVNSVVFIITILTHKSILLYVSRAAESCFMSHLFSQVPQWIPYNLPRIYHLLFISYSTILILINDSGAVVWYYSKSFPFHITQNIYQIVHHKPAIVQSSLFITTYSYWYTVGCVMTRSVSPKYKSIMLYCMYRVITAPDGMILVRSCRVLWYAHFFSTRFMINLLSPSVNLPISNHHYS